MRFAFLFLFCALIFEKSDAASCCGGGASAPALILSDDRWTARLGMQSAYTVGTVDQDGKAQFREDAWDENSLRFSPSFLYRWNDFFQSSVRSSIAEKRRAGEQAWGFGDLAATMALEPFPLYTYSPYRPRTLFYLSLGVPLGTSTYDTNKAMTESFGSGFWSPALGIFIFKSWRAWELSLLGELKEQFARDFEYEDVDPGRVFQSKLGVAYHFSEARLGASLGPVYEESRKLLRGKSQSAAKLVWDFEIEVTHDFSDTWGAGLAYQDQSLIGPAFNVDIQRGLSANVTYHGF